MTDEDAAGAPAAATAGRAYAPRLSVLSERTRGWSPLQVLYLVSIGVFIVALLVVDVGDLRSSVFAWDFRAFYDGGSRYLHLESPYVAGSLAQLTGQRSFVYPPPAAAVFAPVALVPYHLAAALFVSLGVGLLAAALYVLDVRDLRCYAAVLVGAPALEGLSLGTISPILVFVLAIVWRYRDRGWVVAPGLALLVLTKIFLWPIAVWLLATRRVRSAVVASAVTIIAVLLASLPLGFGVFPHYVSLLRTVSRLEGPSSLSLMSVGAALTGSVGGGTALSLTCGGLLLVGSWRSARRGDDASAFRISVIAALALTPILWNHYLLLLFVPLALTRRKFSPLWLATAWVVGAVSGGRLAGLQSTVALCAVWLAVLVQSGLVGDVRALLTRAEERPAAGAFGRLAGVLALGASFAWVLVSLVQVVPAVAALRGGTNAGEVSGTATVRLFRSGGRICTHLLTEGVPLPALAQVLDVRTGSVLVSWRMGAERLDTCGSYSPAGDEQNLAAAFSAHRRSLLLRVVSSGRTVASGAIVRIEDLERSAP